MFDLIYEFPRKKKEEMGVILILNDPGIFFIKLVPIKIPVGR